MGTSHELGQNFATAFGMAYLDESGTQRTAWTTSWGVSTRMLGGLIMGHGDDAGLRLPPALAPVQVVVLAVRDEAGVVERCATLADELRAAGIRVELDTRTEVSYGRRATDWELKGVPVRLELGPRDLADGVVTLARRVSASKAATPLDGVAAAVATALADQQAELLAGATARRDERTVDVDTLGEAREAAGEGFARVPWATIGDDGERFLAERAVTVRCLVRPDGSVPLADDEPDLLAVVGRSY
jgi:prolyl-tRNA synthetase